jgi:hypothetical protein
MNEPFRAIAIEEIAVERLRVSRFSYVWCLEPLSKPEVLVEYQGKRAMVSSKLLRKTPIAPDSAKLRAHDSCFGSPISSFIEVHRNTAKLFSVYRCKAHGQYFLEDIQGGVGMYSRFIFIGGMVSPSEDDFIRIWKDLHFRSTDELLYEGKTGPVPL